MEKIASNLRDMMTKILHIKVKFHKGIHETNNAILWILIRKRFQLNYLGFVVNYLKKGITQEFLWPNKA